MPLFSYRLHNLVCFSEKKKSQFGWTYEKLNLPRDRTSFRPTVMAFLALELFL